MGMFKKITLATVLGATALTATAAPAMARPYYRHHDGGDTAAIAIGAGILGLAVGAIAASNNNRNDRYDDRYYGSSYDNTNYGGGWYYRDGYYFNRDGRRYDRYEWQRHRREHNDWRSDSRRGYDRSEYYDRRGY